MLARAGLLLTLMLAALVPRGGAQVDPALEAALAWLAGMQQMDGGFSNGFSDTSDPGTTADIVIGVVASGGEPRSWRNAGRTPLDFLEAAVAAGAARTPGLAAKLVLAEVAAGEDARSFGGIDLVPQIGMGFDPASGFFGSGPYDSSLALLAFEAVGEAVPPGAVEGLLAARLQDGSYSFSGDRTLGAGDSNTTALAVMALTRVGRPAEVAASLGYFRTAQNEDGGWTYQKPSAFGEETDANSTALVILALHAAGERLSEWRDPYRALLSLQRPDGSFAFNASTPDANLLATVQAIPALALLEASPETPSGQVEESPSAPSPPSSPVASEVATPSARESGAPRSGEGMVLALVAIGVTLAVALWLGRPGRDKPG